MPSAIYRHFHYSPYRPLGAWLACLAVLTIAFLCGCESRRSYECMRTESAPEIDGRLDDTPWQRAAWTADFVDIEGAKRPTPTYRTRAKMLWDDQYLYIAAELEEPHVWATLRERDEIVFNDNDFEIFIDPDGDTENYVEIELNALGTIFDLLLKRTYRDKGPAIREWNVPGLRSAVAVDGTLNDPSDRDRGWSVEAAIPWQAFEGLTSVKLPPEAGDVWRMNFSRVEWEHEIHQGKYSRVPGRPENNWVWSPQGLIDMHVPNRWGDVTFGD
ncbi:MAG: hypothetical protein AMXMBFR20_30400 [Planctomycetia bacterium]|nr:MAG: hypothetical protein B6D36_02550 [Planctomycetes bacterium UTPLA1]